MTENKGLEGIVAAESVISSIEGSELCYSGYKIDDLAENAEFEEVVFLLWNQKLPNEEELAEFKTRIFNHMELNPRVYNHFGSYGTEDVHPMTALRTSISFLAHFDPNAEVMEEAANYEKAIRIQAKISSLVAAFQRVRHDQEIVKPKENLSYAANLFYMINGVEPNDVEVEAMNKALILHADHELNASTFTARVCTATLSDIYSGVTAAVGALKGPLHGGANERVMEMLSEIDSVEDVEEYLQKKFKNKDKIMGMGHRVYKDGDPRAKYLKEMSAILTKDAGQYDLYEKSIKIAEIVEREKGLLPNVDFYSASVYHVLGIDHDLFTPIFAVSRVAGWLAHIQEQYKNNRLIRPRAEYQGKTDLKYVPIEERS